MRIMRPDYGFDYGTDPVLPLGALGTDSTGAVKVGDGVTPWSTLLTYTGGAVKPTVVSTLADVPVDITPGSPIFLRGAAADPILRRRNLSPNPTGRVNADGWISNSGSAVPTRELEGGVPFIRRTAPDTSSNRGMRSPLAVRPSGVNVLRHRIQVRGNGRGAVRITADAWSSTAQVAAGTGAALVNVPTYTDWTDVELVQDLTGSSATHHRLTVFNTNAQDVGATLDARRVLSGPAGGYFDGATASTTNLRYSYEGADGASPSREELILYSASVYVA